jgi:L-amino acid N-acyltransferase YncA
MRALIREYQVKDVEDMTEIWNEVVSEGVAFPQTEPMSAGEARDFFAAQSFCAVAEADGQIAGLYILHPNNVGRCAHIANASYAVSSSARGMKIGEELVRHSLCQAKALGYGVLQFNAVVKSNLGAIRLYETLGFVRLGTIPKGFRLKDGSFEDILIFYYAL